MNDLANIATRVLGTAHVFRDILAQVLQICHHNVARWTTVSNFGIIAASSAFCCCNPKIPKEQENAAHNIEMVHNIDIYDLQRGGHVRVTIDQDSMSQLSPSFLSEVRMIAAASKDYYSKLDPDVESVPGIAGKFGVTITFRGEEGTHLWPTHIFINDQGERIAELGNLTLDSSAIPHVIAYLNEVIHSNFPDYPPSVK